MRFLIKFIMKLHIKIWTWFDFWGERPIIGKATHLSNAFTNAMDQPSTFFPFLLGSLVGREMTKPAGGSWMPILWRAMFFVFFLFLFMDLAVAVFAFLYIAIITIPVSLFILLPLRVFGIWTGGNNDGTYGRFSSEYLNNLWREVDLEHELYRTENLIQSRALFNC